VASYFVTNEFSSFAIVFHFKRNGICTAQI